MGTGVKETRHNKTLDGSLLTGHREKPSNHVVKERIPLDKGVGRESPKGNGVNGRQKNKEKFTCMAGRATGG